MHTCDTASYGHVRWESVGLEHPANFETLAMDPDVKNAIKKDLDRFVKRREFYKKVGRAWKRGYLLYGPPGTGKSTLVAAMANYLNFDIYDLQLSNIHSDSALRKVLLATRNRSIHIDCGANLPDRESNTSPPQKALKTRAAAYASVTLSGLLNFIDGLWSSCGNERIIIFTTNHKERLDPALLRPGRMDMHIHMSYCTFNAFKALASNYLGITSEDHGLFGEIEELLSKTEVTPAEVAEELMRNEDADIALDGVVKLLKQKQTEKQKLLKERQKKVEGGNEALNCEEGETTPSDPIET